MKSLVAGAKRLLVATVNGIDENPIPFSRRSHYALYLASQQGTNSLPKNLGYDWKNIIV